MHRERQRVVLASNRLPVTLVNSADGAVLSPTDDGPASALRALHARGDCCWVGYLGDTAKLEAAAARGLLAQARRSGLLSVSLRASAVSLAYDGYANAVLWPLFHYLLDKVRLDAGAEWRAYVDVNKHFADVIAAQLAPQDTVWIHDYQLALVPALLRQRVPAARIGYFQHIPWPSSDVFRILPSREQLLTGVLGADLVGFQTDNDRQNFVQSATELLGATPGVHNVSWPERDVCVGVYPIGVDVAGFAQRSAAIDASIAQLRASTAGKIRVLGVDQLDCTQGVPQRLLAVDRLLEREPALRDRLHYTQIALPTREEVGGGDEPRTVNELVARINSHYGTATSSPVQLRSRSLPLEQLIALYRAADVMVVTPLRDGMNTNAKEYVAARLDGRGCLVLSEFAGAATELPQALRVNPYDISALARVIRQALFMPEAEQQRRMLELRRGVEERPVQRWAGELLADLRGAYVGARRDAITRAAYPLPMQRRAAASGAPCTTCRSAAYPRHSDGY